jgi:flagellin-like hook-associated protein FlgL
MVPTALKNDWKYETTLSPFALQNDFAKITTGVNSIFNQVEINGSSFTTTQDGYFFINIGNTSVDTIRIEYGNISKSYGGINHGRTIDLGWLEKGTEVTFSDADESIYNLKAVAFTMDMDKFIEFYNELADEGLNVTSYDDTHIKGNINVLNSGLLFTSIPFV